MDAVEKQKLVDAWIKCTDAESSSEEAKINFWAVDKLMDLEFDDPELLWQLIIEILKRDLSDKVFCNLAAGPLESLLAHHGCDFIERIEEYAKSDERFRRLLGGVWQNLMTDDIWGRVQKAAEWKRL